jgi:hypothetical protein
MNPRLSILKVELRAASALNSSIARFGLMAPNFLAATNAGMSGSAAQWRSLNPSERSEEISGILLIGLHPEENHVRCVRLA